MACSILILLWVRDELSYGRFHKNADTLYRVEENQHYSGKVYHVNVTPYPSAPVFKEEIPEIVDATRCSWNIGLLIRHGEKAFFESAIRSVDPTFLQMFTFPLIQGDRNTALNNEESTTDFLLAPFTGLHLYAYFGYGRPMGAIQYVYIFSVVALFVLLLACINFMNLTTARSANRAKEIGMRKVAGALRGNIAGQFLGESILLAFFALVFALLLAMLLLPVFNTLSGKEISNAILADPSIILGLLGITAFTGVVAGSYPALFLSAFRPVSVLKGNLKAGSRSSSLRKMLVVAQFALSIFIIIGTGVVYNQLVYMKNKKLGFEKEHLLYIAMRGEIGRSYKTLKIEMSKGRSFSRDFPSDAGTDSTGAFLINEELEHIMGMESAVGADFSFK